MSNKRIDMSVFPDGFLVEHSLFGNSFKSTELYKFDRAIITQRNGWDYRPALNYWHFNDGSMVLPDGLVVEVMCANGNIVTGITKQGFDGVIIGEAYKSLWGLDWILDQSAPYLIGHNIIAVKIIGVTDEYADHGKELGMEIIEI